MITIETPLTFCEKGRRSTNQDSIFFDAQPEYMTFIVCDGVGGAKDGEVASQIAAQGFGQSLCRQQANEESVRQTLEDVRGKFDQYFDVHPQSRGMGTTIALLQLHKEGLCIAHIGDSRVYHLRNGQCIFCTQDHSLTEELKRKGKIEEAMLAPKNVITRAIQGSTGKSAPADVYLSKDVRDEDIFFLCTDGVWGCMDEEHLLNILSENKDASSKISGIKQWCEHNSKDNYTAIMVIIKTSNIYSSQIALECIEEVKRPFWRRWFARKKQ